LGRARCMFIGLVHDLGESVVGDIPTFAGIPKGRRHIRQSPSWNQPVRAQT
ncbi:hypothetical protein P152DRAFT_386946, partial [Eremomyces bilateralis CBS 781.70]